jgi:hypothetical protein
MHRKRLRTGASSRLRQPLSEGARAALFQPIAHHLGTVLSQVFGGSKILQTILARSQAETDVLDFRCEKA